MAVLVTNYDIVKTEKFYKAIQSQKVDVSDNLVDILSALSDYCDKHTLPDSGYCYGCPFYTEKTSNECLVKKNGYGIPHEWAIYEENERLE